MKTQHIYKPSLKKKIVFALAIIASITLLVVATCLSFQSTKPLNLYKPNSLIILSDTTGMWEDNFDSTYVFNGCIHYTHKQI